MLRVVHESLVGVHQCISKSIEVEMYKGNKISCMKSRIEDIDGNLRDKLPLIEDVKKYLRELVKLHQGFCGHNFSFNPMDEDLILLHPKKIGMKSLEVTVGSIYLVLYVFVSSII